MGECSCLIDSMVRYIGQTVTIFTSSGGLSGSGFTGVLASINNCCCKLITDIGAPPACPVGSSCGYGLSEPITEAIPYTGRRGWNWGGGSGCGCRWGGGGFNWLGSVTEIPLDRIVSFTHNAL